MKRSHGGSSSASVAKRVDDKATVTIAIDFGTAGTGYAYCFAGSDVIEAKQPGGQDARKTLTNLLLDRNGAFKAFGFEARRMYSESGQGDFFSNYKMLLENVGSVGGATMVRAPPARRARFPADRWPLSLRQAKAHNGSRVPLLDVLKKTLSYVKDEVLPAPLEPSPSPAPIPVHAFPCAQALKECGRALPNGLVARDCQWVLTVPAIWTDAGKGFMRKAAFQAGLIDVEDSRRLLFALEPESAAIASDVAQHVRPGQSFMVLDCGGGTVDITMNRLKSTSPLRLDEIAAPSGGPWGSTFVDIRFEDFVKELVGVGNFNAIMETPYWIELLENWESVKTSQTADGTPRTVNFSPLLEVLEEGTKLSEKVETYNARRGTTLKMRGRSTVVMEASFVRDFFNNTFTKIATHCSWLMQSNPVEHIFLVGGFAESELLQTLIKSRFDSSRCKVVVPVRPGLAVLRGAVQFGMNQDVFASRMARFTYGHNHCSQYDSANPKHLNAPVEMKDTPSGKKKYATDLFRNLVKVGSKLPSGHKAESTGWRVVGKTQATITLQIFSTPLGDIDVVSGARQIGSVDVPCTHEQSVTLSLEFGGTEILASAVNETTGHTAEAKLRYD